MHSPLPPQPLRVAFLGAGGIAAAHAAALKTVPGVELAATCDLDGNKARDFQRRWSIPRAFDDVGAMLDGVKPDVVHVLLPPTAHAQAVETCLAAGANVFVEKPFCISSEECLRAGRVAQASGLQIGVNHNFTFMPGLLAAIDAIRGCRLGAVEHMSIVYSFPMPGLAAGPHSHWMFADPANIIFELGAHPLSAIYRYVGKCVSTKTLTSHERKLTNGATFYAAWQASLACERGTAQMFLSVGNPYYNVWIHLLGEDGEIVIDVRRYTVYVSENTRYLRTGHFVDLSKTAWSLLRQGLSNFRAYSLGAIGIAPAPSWQQTSMEHSLGAFYSAIQAGKPVPVGAAEGTAVVEMCEAVIESGLAAERELHRDIVHG